jgi:hypothetical protein
MMTTRLAVCPKDKPGNRSSTAKAMATNPFIILSCFIVDPIETVVVRGVHSAQRSGLSIHNRLNPCEDDPPKEPT